MYSRIEQLPNCKNAAGQTQNRKNFFWPNGMEWVAIAVAIALAVAPGYWLSCPPKSGNYAKSLNKTSIKPWGGEVVAGSW